MLTVRFRSYFKTHVLQTYCELTVMVRGDCRHFELLSDPGRAILGWDKQTRREACVKMVPARVERLRRTRKWLP